jgi:hypothetical protein
MSGGRSRIRLPKNLNKVTFAIKNLFGDLKSGQGWSVCLHYDDDGSLTFYWETSRAV